MYSVCEYLEAHKYLEFGSYKNHSYTTGIKHIIVVFFNG